MLYGLKFKKNRLRWAIMLYKTETLTKAFFSIASFMKLACQSLAIMPTNIWDVQQISWFRILPYSCCIPNDIFRFSIHLSYIAWISTLYPLMVQQTGLWTSQYCCMHKKTDINIFKNYWYNLIFILSWMKLLYMHALPYMYWSQQFCGYN